MVKNLLFGCFFGAETSLLRNSKTKMGGAGGGTVKNLGTPHFPPQKALQVTRGPGLNPEGVATSLSV